ncbi:chromosome condensation protein CrcB [Parafrankia colletiae]|uniref:Fluoride-specific ion channel FluC n=1 Tax=Parafrankia colletiae TaxID=573497 RepID=A0A1S1QPK1_9ACTN|nr:CrcB family protein [Parafrankia colletiae]MCK9903676.1 CrcB family protein [Frankia sp. Cpl3]OHV36668.1 chromosome condensation protein CrcB [Parafrankia colletiae]
MTWLLVIAGAAVGAPLRYLTDRAVQARHSSRFPWGTFAVNVVASLVLGVVTGAVTAGAASDRLALLLGPGLCGALSTYSTFSYETLLLVEEGALLLAAANVAGSVLATFAAAAAGVGIAELWWG